MNIRSWLKRRMIGVLMGGDSAERSISLKTGKAILASLQRQGFRAKAVDPRGNPARALKKANITFAYMALHGPGGEDGRIQSVLDEMGIPYTGSGVLASAAAMDKVISKQLFDSAKLSSAPWLAVTRQEASMVASWVRRTGYPVVVKPASQGSAIGVSVVKRPGQLASALRLAFRYGGCALIEKFLKGPEITVGVLGKTTLPIIEIVPQARTFYDFHAKYAQGGSRHILPARISTAAARKSRALALGACKVLGTRAVARVDLIVDVRRGPMLLEVNTIPGMTETSLLPEAARAAGYDFDALVLKIAEYSLASH